MKQRQSGILLHISSLPSSFGIGDLGPQAYQFVDFLHKTQQSCWQILPLNPTDGAHKNSPYSSAAAFAGNKLFISPEVLVKEGFLKAEDLKSLSLAFKKDKVDFDQAHLFKNKILQLAYVYFKNISEKPVDWDYFIKKQSFWLDSYALFMTIKEEFPKKMWSEWPKALKQRDAQALEEFSKKFKDKIEKVKFEQYLFFKQWHALKEYCCEKGIKLIGDIPIYVTYDSVDVWSYPQYFKLDEGLNPYVVAGVPPDYFSETGQRWGNPVYKWDVLKADGYRWWIERVKVNLELFDMVRIDHFRGMVNYWEIPAEEKTAMNGYWVDVPTDDFFNTMKSYFGRKNLPVIAEDLGIITDEVREAMKRQGFPGMKILMFAFGDDERNPYLPHNYSEDCIVYTGTHDNNTVQGWYQNDMNGVEKKNLENYLGKEIINENIHWDIVELAMKSHANIAIIPLQDILGLGQKARMNKPATIKGNWNWQFSPKALTSQIINKLLQMTELSGRMNKE